MQNQARRQADLRKYQTEKAVQEQSRLGIIGDCAYFSESDYPEPLLKHRLPSLYDANNVCLHCGALRWKQERAGFCCENGRVQLASPAKFPPTLMEIYGNKNFLQNIRAYNNAMALASVGCHEQILPNWNPTFKIQGKVFHRIGALTPAKGDDPKFAQIYFTDTEHEVENRLTHNKHLDVNILRTLQTCLKDVNPYIQSLKYATDFSADNPDTQIIIEAKKKPQEEHARRFNAPTGSEVAIIMPGDHIEHLDVILQSKGGDIQTINEMHRSYDPLHYVLLFPFGDDGYTDNIPQSTLTKRKDKSTLRVQFPQPSTSAAASIVPSNKRITPSQFYRYKLQVRPKEDNMLLKSRRLTQQYATDMFAKVESQRLRWVKNNQKEIRADKYRCLLDAIDADDERNAGRKVILPPTVYGSPRWYAEAFQDAMALVRKFGKPDLFITMTTNPNWPEIQHSLFPGESPVDRPDITARVFNIKHKELLDELIQKQTLGKVLAYTSMKEDQKRGLPHAHILCIMAPEDKPRTPKDIDKLVSAEIPDKNTNPKLHAIVTKHMCHGPCGNVNVNSPCMETKGSLKVCGKQFPKEFCSATTVTPNGYPKYRRRAPDDGGRTYNAQVRGNEFTVDNSWIVPYNPYISLKFNAHINVEVVTSVESVKYIYKYTHKGSDRVVVRLANGQDKDITNDEVERYVNARYIGASEAYWRLYEFPISQRYPAVEKLPLHLENEQVVFFQPDTARATAEKSPPETKLTAYFQLNQTDETARNVLYPDMYQFYTYNQQTKKWIKRKRNLRKHPTNNPEQMSDTIGRIPIIALNANQSEIYFLRMLLYHRPGATSYADLRTVEGKQCPDFQSACLKLGLLQDDTEIDKVMEETASVQFGTTLRQTFATILLWTPPSDSLAFYQRHLKVLAEDLLHRDGLLELNDQIINEVLCDVEDHLQRQGKSVEDFGLPMPDTTVTDQDCRILREETVFDMNLLQSIVDTNLPNLNDEQSAAFHEVVNSVENDLGLMIALDAPAGTGKTYLISTILAYVRSKGYVALATATSGIAATLLMNGRTLHSRCKVPVTELHDTSMCNVTKRDQTGQLFQKTNLLIIDEVTMANKNVYETVERTFRDIRGNDRTFGGVTVLFSGDWRQILPVVRHGSRADIVNACLKASALWADVKVMQLSKNMRVNPHEVEFAQELLTIGEGRHSLHEDLGEYKIQLHEEYLLTHNTIDALCDFVWEDFDNSHNSPEWLSTRAVLCPTNKEAEDVNNHMMAKFPGVARTYKSADRILDEDLKHQYPEEFLNTLTPSGMAPHNLTLKPKCQIMLLRNIDPANGHCNGTRYYINSLHDHVIEATIATGVHAGKRLFIPRIPMRPSDNIFPFQMERRQFPIKVCFGMSANKSQGQTLSRIGLYLTQDFFSHGQLYVAMSRVQNKNNLKIVILNGQFAGKDGMYTDNVVYKEILT